jgi:death-on-curing protein
MGLLQSALAMPQASLGQEWLHRDLYEMAAAYAYHISQNQPFFDGNKRTALACALVFLELNGISLADPKGRLYQASMDLAAGTMDKWEMAGVFKSLALESGP